MRLLFYPPYECKGNDKTLETPFNVMQSKATPLITPELHLFVFVAHLVLRFISAGVLSLIMRPRGCFVGRAGQEQPDASMPLLPAVGTVIRDTVAQKIGHDLLSPRADIPVGCAGLGL